MKTPIVAGILLVTQWFLAQAPAATIDVINAKDSLAGSLRQAIQDALAGDTINFTIPTTDSGYDAATGITTINLTTTELTIGRDLTIDGAGAKIVIQRSSAAGTPDLRIFNVTTGMVTISNISLSRGLPSSGDGGAILNAGNLTVNGCTFSNNGIGDLYGGGIDNSGALTVNNCTFTLNDADRGAAIYNTGTLTVVNSTITGNLPGASRGASGVWNVGVVAHIHNSVIAGNNVGVGNPSLDVFGTFVSDGYNFIGATDNSTGFGEPGSHDQTGTSAAPADPGLGPLRDNGGVAFTFEPNAGSPLIDQGSAGGLTIDQVGLPRVIDDPAIVNAGDGDGSDIGAVERDLAQSEGFFLSVNSTDERSDGICGVNDCTLIEALDVSNSFSNTDFILFKEGLSGTITTNRLTPGGLSIINPVQIIGPDARQLTISGNGAARVFEILSGDVTLSGLTITDGSAANVGGAIYVNSTLVNVENCTVSESTATGLSGKGGGIFAESGSTVAIRNCTVSGNTGGAGGGGIYNNGGIVTVNDSTIANNQTSGVGGGIYNFGGDVYLVDCTVNRNEGNGLRADGGIFSLANTLVAGNTVAGNPPDVIGTFTSGGYNLIGNSDGTNGFTDGVNHDLVGTPALPLEPGLDFFGLQNNGGSTDTIALVAGSVAIDGANPATASERDQRGFDRVDAPDIGAFEFGGTQPVTLANISTRLFVDTGDNVLIGGFIVTGTHTKTVLLRAIGPSLPLAGFLANPTLELYDSTGSLLLSNDDWQSNSNVQQIIDSGIAPTNALESVLFDLSPGAYTAIVRGANNGTGIALVEAYDLDRTVDSQLANISTRGLVQTGDNVLIGGFIVLGSQDEDVIVRAIGPSLPVVGKLLDPTLELHNSDGSILASNDNWRDTQEDEIIATGIPPTNDAESAIATTLAPGPYTAIVSGAGGTTGVALVEIYGLQ